MSTIAAFGLDLADFVGAWDDAIPFSMDLCNKVMANCFVNATYDPELRNGTCPSAIDEFYVGFIWENSNNNAMRPVRRRGLLAQRLGKLPLQPVRADGSLAR